MTSCPEVGNVIYSLHLLPVVETVLLAWAATTRDRDYIRMEGLTCLVTESKYRKEVVAGGLTQYLVAGALNPPNWRQCTDLP
jgi:hypothetical protein